MELGRGGMGAVHLVMTSGPQAFAKQVVFKTLLPELLRSAAARRMFLEEARISARIAHPNVVRVHEVVEHDGVPTMVMEYLRGLPLSTVLGDDPTRLTLQLHLYVLRHVLSGLHAAHELRDNDGTSLGLVHRDVSPHNIFLEFDGGVKVLDFGIAKAGRSQIRTETGELKGKLRYMAPEQFCGDRDLDRRADIFSVGVMLWEVLAGHRIWEQQSDADVMRHLLNAEIPALPESPLIPAGLSAVCRRALEPSAAARYSTAAEFARDLEQNIGDLREGGGAEDLSAFMMAQFGEAHESTKRAIEAQVNAPLAEIDPPAADSRPTGMPEGRTNALRTTRPSGRMARSRRWARRWAVGAGILGIRSSLSRLLAASSG
jgi:serine/threonine-protein kinase